MRHRSCDGPASRAEKAIYNPPKPRFEPFGFVLETHASHRCARPSTARVDLYRSSWYIVDRALAAMRPRRNESNRESPGLPCDALLEQMGGGGAPRFEPYIRKLPIGGPNFPSPESAQVGPYSMRTLRPKAEEDFTLRRPTLRNSIPKPLRGLRQMDSDAFDVKSTGEQHWSRCACIKAAGPLPWAPTCGGRFVSWVLVYRSCRARSSPAPFWHI